VAPKTSEPLSSSGARNSPSPTPAPDFSVEVTPNPNPVVTSPSPKPTESPKTTPPSPWSHGVSSTGRASFGDDPARPQLEDLPQRSPQVAKTVAKDPDFIKVGFHIGRFITTAVDIEVGCTNIKALWTDLNFASTRINVSISCLVLCHIPSSTLTLRLSCRN
jgi:hypothetical protein